MKLSLRRIAVLAGLVALGSSALAVDPDATIVISRSLNSPTFSVRYSGAAVALAELRVNGESVTTRNLNASVTSGETSFSISLSSLLDGENEVEVRLFDKSGKLVGTQKSIVNQDSSEKPAVFLTTPKVGASVQGPVEIKVGFGQKLKDSYVSFFIDNQFRTMSNVAPFSYVWDTGRENNGWHELEAWVVNSGNDTLKSKKVRVFVDNPGGHTNRRFVSTAKPATPAAKPEELLTVGNPVKIVPAAIHPAAATTLPLTLLATSVSAKVGIASGLRPNTAPLLATVASTGLRHMTPTGKRLADKPVVKAATSKVSANSVKPAAIKAKPIVEVKSSTNQGRIALPGSPVTGMAVTHIRPLSTTEETAPVSAGAVTLAPTSETVKAPVAQPHPTRTESVAAVPVAAKAGAVHKSSTVTTLVKVQPGFKLPAKGSFAIIMDGDIVEFDVQPRVEASGVPMTPFRHLIEKKGGNVKWEAKTKEVNANADGKDIYLQIGTRVARVDKKSINLELAPYLEKGRTIVPLSFIRDSLNVNVDYDKATGHVLITSVK